MDSGRRGPDSASAASAAGSAPQPPRPKPRRVALFGGTFDPVHRAHVALAQVALQALALDEVRWIPSGQPWQKAREGRRISAAEDRAAMVALAIANEPRFVLDRVELDRTGPSYTIDTVQALAAAQRGVPTQWLLLIGQDQFARLHTWHRWRELLALVTLAVAQRPGAPAAADPGVHAVLASLAQRPLAVPLPAMDISASEIRQRVAAAAGEAEIVEVISELVPAEVAGYIARHGLYRTPSGS